MRRVVVSQKSWIRKREIRWLQKIVGIAKNYILKFYKNGNDKNRSYWLARRSNWSRLKTTTTG